MTTERIAATLFTLAVVALVWLMVLGIEDENRRRAACPGYYNVAYGCGARLTH
jgi:hypothetical protein